MSVPPLMIAPVVIAPVSVEASDALALLHAKAFDAPWSALALAQTIAAPFAIGFQAGEPAGGFILAQAVAGEAEILTLAVDPAARRRGVARALVEAVLNAARDAGADALWLEVAEDNAAARALYAAAGFDQVGLRRRYYPRAGGAVDALSLRRRLNSTAS